MNYAEIREQEWFEANAWEEEVRCANPACGEVELRTFTGEDGEAHDPCTADLPDGTECGWTEVERT